MLESERSTRASRIDPKLRAQGWRIVPYEETKLLAAYDRCAIKEFPTANGPVDYALCVDGRILGLVEAKKLAWADHHPLAQLAPEHLVLDPEVFDLANEVALDGLAQELK